MKSKRKNTYFCCTKDFPRGYGGIGRRARLRIWCRKACGFESLYPHQFNFFIPSCIAFNILSFWDFLFSYKNMPVQNRFIYQDCTHNNYQINCLNKFERSYGTNKHL
jgi:hypothetical protein